MINQEAKPHDVSSHLIRPTQRILINAAKATLIGVTRPNIYNIFLSYNQTNHDLKT